MNSTFVVLSRAVSIIGGVLLSASVALAQAPSVGPNVNMVTGTTWPAGDPFLTKQNEPSLAVSSLNPQHLFGGANDYRLVNPVCTNGSSALCSNDSGGDAWVTVYKSVDGGVTWRTSMIQGCPLSIPECGTSANPIKAAGLQFAADPTVRPGPYGTFFYSFIAANRGTNVGAITAIQRFIDQNNNIGINDDPFLPDAVNIVDTGTAGQLSDKPWNIADVPGRSFNTGTCVIPGYNNNNAVPAFNVYISYANFLGQVNQTNNPHPQILVARSTDCGKTFGKPVKVSNSLQTNQGSNLAIDPQTGTVYVFWRVVNDASSSTVDAIYMSKSIDGGVTWSNQPILVANIVPFDQGSTGFSFRTLTFPAAAASVALDSSTGNFVSRVHVMWAQRKAALSACIDASGNLIPGSNCDARMRMATSKDGGATWNYSWVDNWDNTDPSAHQDPSVPPVNPNRGHQFMPALSFAGGKLMALWYDQRLDHTSGRMVCPTGSPSCASMSNFVEVRDPVGNLAATPPSPQFVFTPFLADIPYIDTTTNPPHVVIDASLGLIRRHTIDVFAAMADPSDMPAFTSSRVSQYLFGSPNPCMSANCPKTPASPVQQQQNPPDLPIAAGGTTPFMGDYIDVAARTIVATGNTVQPYAFDCGNNINNTSGNPVCLNTQSKPVFHPAWSDNRDVGRPWNGNWTAYTPIKIFNSGTNPTGVVVNNSGSLACVPGTGQDGSRNQNIYTAAIAEGSVGLVSANSKSLYSVQPAQPRGFAVGIQNLSTAYHTYTFTIVNQPTGGIASFDQATFTVQPPPNPLTTVTVIAPPLSSSWREVWVTSSNSSASVTVNIFDVTNPSVPVQQVVLNPDPQATLALVANTDGTTTDLASNTLSNATLTNVTLSNNTLTNVTLSNVTLSNATLTNIDPTDATLSNATLTNAVLTNATLSNATLTNVDISNATLSNVTLSNTDLADATLTNNTLTNATLTNSAPADVNYAVTSSSNTDTTTDVKTLLANQTVPAGYTLQFVLRKVSLVPNAVGNCTIGLLQQNGQVTNVSTPTPADPNSATLPQFLPPGDPATQGAPTLPLFKGEKAQLTLRVVKNTNCTSTGCDAGDPTGAQANAFAQTGDKFAAIGAAGNTTSIPLIIKTFTLPPVVVHKTTTLTNALSSLGGKVKVTLPQSTVTWTGLNLPPWITLSPSNGVVANTTSGSTISLVVNKPPNTGTFTLQFQVTDQSIPAQVDTQTLLLVVTANNP